MTNVVCITGMHRSGTSLFASWLNHGGLPMHDGDIIGPHLGNEKGHFEDRDFVQLQSDAILAAYPKSRGWQCCPSRGLCFSEAGLNTAKSMIARRNAKYASWGWKDPRTTLFLKQWKEVMPQLKVIVLWRPCAKVVASLLKRSMKGGRSSVFEISALQAVKLWLAYNRLAVEFVREYSNDTLLFRSDYLGRQDCEVLRILKARLGINLQDKPISDIYDDTMVHNSQGAMGYLISQIPAVRNLERLLNDLSFNFANHEPETAVGKKSLIPLRFT